MSSLVWLLSHGAQRQDVAVEQRGRRGVGSWLPCTGRDRPAAQDSKGTEPLRRAWTLLLGPRVSR